MPKLSDDVLQQAVATAQSQKKPNISAIARTFGISRHTLKARLDGRKTLSQRAPTTNKLSSIQEQVMAQWLFKLDDLNVPATPEMVRNCADRILKRNAPEGTDTPRVGSTWLYNFLQRVRQKHPELRLRKPRTLEKDLIDAQDIGEITHYFDILKRQIELHNIEPCNIYNIDETGFQLRQGLNQSMVTVYKNKRSLTARGENITGVECIAADG
jgi:transposase-like protein